MNFSQTTEFSEQSWKSFLKSLKNSSRKQYETEINQFLAFEQKIKTPRKSYSFKHTILIHFKTA
jgi:hypothetical protein